MSSSDTQQKYFTPPIDSNTPLPDLGQGRVDSARFSSPEVMHAEWTKINYVSVRKCPLIASDIDNMFIALDATGASGGANDFIDMRRERYRRTVEHTLRDAVKRDRARTKILRTSPFGLIEMTRQRIRPCHKKRRTAGRALPM